MIMYAATNLNFITQYKLYDHFAFHKEYFPALSHFLKKWDLNSAVPSRERHGTVQDKCYGKDIKKFRHSTTQTAKNIISPALKHRVYIQSWLHSQFSQLIRFYTSKPITYKSNSAHVTSICAATYVPHPRTIYIRNEQCTHNPNLLLNTIVIQNQQSSWIPHLLSKNCL